MKKYKDYKLCYIDDGMAYFTRKKLSEQWGDDWNDSPYEHNAGEPYYENKDDIIKIYFKAWAYKEPCDGHYNSPYSVQDINNMEVPWLEPRYKNEHLAPIFAGCSVNDFIDLILKAEGEVFVPISFSNCSK